MKTNGMSILGYMTDSISLNDSLENIKLLAMSRTQQFKLYMKETWGFLLIMMAMCFVVPYFFWVMGGGNPTLSVRFTLSIGGILFIMLTGLITMTQGRFYVINRQESLMDISEMYRTFIRDLVSIGAYEINLHEDPFLPKTQNWVNKNKEGKDFIKKVIEARNIPAVKPEYIKKDSGVWTEYVEIYQWFQDLSAFVLKLSV